MPVWGKICHAMDTEIIFQNCSVFFDKATPGKRNISLTAALPLYKNAADAKLVKDLAKRWRFYKDSSSNISLSGLFFVRPEDTKYEIRFPCNMTR